MILDSFLRDLHGGRKLDFSGIYSPPSDKEELS